MEIGELSASYLFATVAAAKQAWESVASRVRNVSVNRWSLDPDDPKQGRVVTVLTEEEQRAGFETACELLGRHGTQVTAPDYVIRALAMKRARKSDGGRHVVRSGLGMRVAPDGRSLGPLRRPRG